MWWKELLPRSCLHRTAGFFPLDDRFWENKVFSGQGDHRQCMVYTKFPVRVICPIGLRWLLLNILPNGGGSGTPKYGSCGLWKSSPISILYPVSLDLCHCYMCSASGHICRRVLWLFNILTAVLSLCLLISLDSNEAYGVVEFMCFAIHSTVGLICLTLAAAQRSCGLTFLKQSWIIDLSQDRGSGDSCKAYNFSTSGASCTGTACFHATLSTLFDRRRTSKVHGMAGKHGSDTSTNI